MRAGVTALKIEGRQRSRAYVKAVVAAFRKAVDDLMAGREAAFASLLGAHRRPPRDARRLRRQAMEMTVQAQSQLTLGPVLFNWAPEALARLLFPHRRRGAGCERLSRRSDLLQARAIVRAHLAEVSERLTRAGKTVVYSTLSEVMSKLDRNLVETSALPKAWSKPMTARRCFICAGGRITSAPSSTPITSTRSPCLPAMARATSACRRKCRARPSARSRRRRRSSAFRLEVQVFGRIGLALSARCYHARAHGRTKDSCHFVCDEDPDGMALRTIENAPFLTVNGIQTMSHDYLNLAGELSDLEAMGVAPLPPVAAYLRHGGSGAIFRAALDRRLDAAEATAGLPRSSSPRRFPTAFSRQARPRLGPGRRRPGGDPTANSRKI